MSVLNGVVTVQAVAKEQTVLLKLAGPEAEIGSASLVGPIGLAVLEPLGSSPQLGKATAEMVVYLDQMLSECLRLLRLCGGAILVVHSYREYSGQSTEFGSRAADLGCLRKILGELGRIEFGVEPTGFEEVAVGAPLGDPALVEH